ncbi:MAG TPA: aminotransferase class I/II-fold pyridoxal phosphate-dependent enzyme [Phycisphaerales bacterium]|nr:aminotransferase class I/II-fold pyridoxal phosphate-dependent enzyme [Phycisphaerales bacterium]
MKDISKNILSCHVTLRDSMEALNKGVFGVVFVVNDDGSMVGLVTDGDIRRILLSGADLSDSLEPHMNRKFIAGHTGLERSENINLLTEKVRHIPVLDDDGRPVDMISWAEMWRLPIMEPTLAGSELKYVSDCISSNWISSQGEYIKLFERSFCDYLCVDHSLTATSGTTALHLAIVAMGIGLGDEVIIPDLTFGASANAVIHAGAKPVMVDANSYTWTIDPDVIEKKITERTRAIMSVHLYGHPCDMDPIMEIARRHNLFVIEDCAEALGAKYKGKHVGTIGDVGCFSFFANKVITTGEGGMVTTNNQALFDKMNLLKNHGMAPEKRYWHLHAGFNYRMTNLQAAVGLAQMECIYEFISNRRKMAECYRHELEDVSGITLPPEAAWAKNIYWLYSIVIDEQKLGITRNSLARSLLDHGIETRPFFYPLHTQPAYSKYLHGDCFVSQKLSLYGLSLPASNHNCLKDVHRVCDTLKKTIEKSRQSQPAICV